MATPGTHGGIVVAVISTWLTMYPASMGPPNGVIDGVVVPGVWAVTQ